MTPKNLIPVLDTGMCIGCGACVAADPSLSLELDADNQIWQPNGPGNAAAAAVCPAIRVDFDRLHKQVFPDQEVTVHGVVERVLLAQSTNEDRNRAASSGGLIKELMLEMLASGEADGVIALTEIQGLDYEPRLITELDQVDELPGSIYHHIPFDNALRILRDKPGRYVLVAIPCQLEGIYNYIVEHEPDLADRIVLTIGLLCGWLYNHHALRAVAQFKRIPFEEIRGVSYRGGGPVGKLKLKTPEKEKAVSRRIDFDYQVAFDRSFNTARCHLCINHSNFLADVVVGDAWLPATLTTRTGISLVICRKKGTPELVQRIADAGKLVYTDVTTEEITESQTRRVVFGDFAYAYGDYLREIGRHTPDMDGPNRPAAHLAARDRVKEFDDELQLKRELQREGKYRRLWLRKASVEFWSLASRYFKWFFVRVLRIKSVTGQRHEVERDKMSIFR